jgi:hypothetical protein
VPNYQRSTDALKLEYLKGIKPYHNRLGAALLIQEDRKVMNGLIAAKMAHVEKMTVGGVSVGTP